MFKSKNKIINSNGEDGQTEPNKSAVYKYMPKSLSKVAQQLSDLQQRHPEMIIKGVVINGGAPWFSGSINPKYHPNFSKVDEKVGGFDKHTNHIGIGGVVIIDVDDTPMFEEHYPELLSRLENTPKYMSRNKKGYHYLVKMKNAPSKACSKISKGKVHIYDVLNGCQASWCKHPIENLDNDLVEVDYNDAMFQTETIEKCFTEANDSEEIDEEVVVSPKSVTELPEEVEEYIEEHFPECCLGVKEMSHAFTIDLGKSKEAKYCPFEKRHHSKSNTYLTYSKKKHTLHHKCHCGNCKGKKELLTTFGSVDMSELTDHKLAKMFVEQYGDVFVRDADATYFYNGWMWHRDASEHHLYYYLNEKFYTWMKEQYHKQNSMDTDDKGATFKAIRGLRQQKKKVDIIKEINRLIFKEIEFDSIWYYIHFTNGVLDLRTMEFGESKPEYLNSQCLGYDYAPRDETKMAWFMENVITRIFPDLEDRKTYLQYLSTALEGRTLEKMMIARGGGRNGKGVINELMIRTMGDYGHQCDANLFLGKVKDGANPALASLGNKRFVVFSEPNKASFLNASMIKLITGTEKVSARMLYSNKVSTTLQLTLVEETNARVKIDNVDEALEKRLEEVYFPSTFSNDPEIADKVNVFPCDVSFKTKEFKNEYKMTMMWILIEHYKQYKEQEYELFVSDATKQRTKDYLDDNNDFFGWFKEHYERVEGVNGMKDLTSETQIIPMKKIYLEYKFRDYYQNMTKAEKRQMNYRRFCQDLRENMRLKHWCSEKGVRPCVDGKQQSQPFVYGWKKSEQTFDEDSDEDF